MLYGFSILKAEEVLEDIIGTIPHAFADGENEIAFPEYLVDLGPERRYRA